MRQSPVPQAAQFHKIEGREGCAILQLVSADGTNRLSHAVIAELIPAVESLSIEAARNQIKALIITGNERFFSVGANLKEISQLTATDALQSARRGQALMNSLASFSVPVIAAVRGYCMGGAMDMALACGYRIAAPNAVFGHRGAALGIMTGWGGTQRLPRLIGKARALEIFITAEKVSAARAYEIGLVNAIADDPVRSALEWARPAESVPSGRD
jgi:enoyl-CoA hydratase/carnithine racemase